MSTRTIATEPILGADNLVKHFPIVTRRGFRKHVDYLQAVDGVSVSIGVRETLGVVGESGSGKSTLLKLLARLIEPTSGSISFLGREQEGLSGKALTPFRRNVQMIYQDPYGQLNPRMTIEEIVTEPWIVHPGVVPRERFRPEAAKLLDTVGIRANLMSRYPAEFSGGQQQRVGIARALALRPQVILCDEPVSALDVSIQAQVILLLKQLQEEYGLSYVFVTHDVSVVRSIADRVSVMYLGRIVETGSVDAICDSPQHPYTQALLSAVPRLVTDKGSRVKRTVLPGEIPNPADPPSGCRFRTRCWKADGLCEEVDPALERHDSSSQLIACHYPSNAKP